MKLFIAGFLLYSSPFLQCFLFSKWWESVLHLSFFWYFLYTVISKKCMSLLIVNNVIIQHENCFTIIITSWNLLGLDKEIQIPPLKYFMSCIMAYLEISVFTTELTKSSVLTTRNCPESTSNDYSVYMIPSRPYRTWTGM